MWSQQVIERLEILYKNESIRVINFNTNDVNFILGEVEDSHVTSNSLGKTALIDLIDLGYGCKKNKPISKIKDLEICYTFENGDIVSRECGGSKIKVNGVDKTLKSYIEYIDRPEGISGIIHKEQRKQIYEYIPKGNDINNYKLFYSLLDMNEIKRYTEEVYKISNEIEILENYQKTSKEDKEESSLLNQEIQELEKKLNLIEKKNEQVIRTEILERYENFANLEENRKEKKIELALSNDRLKKLERYNQKKSNIEDKRIKNIYSVLTKSEQKLVKRKVEEVNEFHDAYLKETSERINNEINNIKKKTKTLINDINRIDKDLEKIKNIVESSTEIDMIFKCYGDLNVQLQLKREEYGRKDFIRNVSREIEDKTQKQKILMEEINANIDNYSEDIEKCRKYLSEFITLLYNGELKTTFTIEPRKINKQTKYPFKIDFKVESDEGEGVSNVKNLAIDLMAFEFNQEIKFQVWDSKCFNGIDPNQTQKIFQEIKRICKEYNKQAIICLNKFQINQDIMNEVEENVILKLSKEETLLNMNF